MTRRPPWKTIPLLLALSLPGAAPAGTIELVESFPVETDMDNPDIPDAYDVWLEMIGTAAESLAFAEFYASNEEGSRLEDIVRAVEEAARRGVSVRFLGEKGFYETYPETLDRLAATEGISVRIFDTGAVMGGVHHAKYFLVDGREAFLGSQNFDWRSLTHIQELGVRIREPSLVDGLGRIFQMDWDAAGGAPRAAGEPVPWEPSAPVVIAAGSDTTTVSLVASPEKWLPEEISWDLPRVVELMDGAASTLRVQLLTYRAVGRDKTYFDALESALRRAAARGVRVEMLLADWSKRSGSIEGLQSLQAVPGIDVKLATVPEWSGGFIPFARVIHAKYLVVDGARGWIGTSNWEQGYFFSGRNVGLVIEGALCERLDRFFLEGWDGPYAVAVDPCGSYEPPNISGE